MHRWRADLTRAVLVVVGCVLLGAPAGLLWSAVAPRLSVTVENDGIHAPDIESTKTFIGADGSYLLVMLVAGILCGTLAWLFARRSGPWTVVALGVGGALAALIGAKVGLMPGSKHAIAALSPHSPFRGRIDLFLGSYGKDHHLHLRAPWAAVAWPVGAATAFLVGASMKPEEVD